MSKENEVRQGIQQAKAGELGLGIIAFELLGLSYYAGYMTESTGLGLLAFIILTCIFFSVSNNETISAWFSLIMGGIVTLVLLAANLIEGENDFLTVLLVSLLAGGLVIGGNFTGLQHLRDLRAMSPHKGQEETKRKGD